MHDHDQLIHPNTEPLQVASVTIEQQHVHVDFVSDVPDHRHMSMGFQFGENPALDRCLAELANVLRSAATVVMMDLVGSTTAPDTTEDFVPKWQCRICDVIAPAYSEGWVTTGTSLAAVQYCPNHRPAGTRV